MQLKASSLFTLLLLAYTIMILILTLPFPFQPKILPLIVVIITLVLLTIQLLLDIVAIRSNKKKENGGNRTDDEVTPKSGAFSEIRLFIWLILLVVALFYLDYILAIGLFLLFFLRFESKISWKSTVILSLCMTASVFVVFRLLLNFTLL